MTDHTPGPWRAKDGEIVAADGDILGVVYRTEAWSSGEPVETEDQANARLIAAAPDLLEALKAFVAADDKQLAHTPETADRARSAIARAELGGAQDNQET